jgi:hypothetical protein
MRQKSENVLYFVTSFGLDQQGINWAKIWENEDGYFDTKRINRQIDRHKNKRRRTSNIKVKQKKFDEGER